MSSASPFLDVVTTPEHTLVEAIFSDALLARSIGIPISIQSSWDLRLRVPPRDLDLPKSAFGDADALLIERGRPAIASAVEFKRVKIKGSTLASGKPNKLSELAKAVRQANALWSAGFAHVLANTQMRPRRNG